MRQSTETLTQSCSGLELVSYECVMVPAAAAVCNSLTELPEDSLLSLLFGGAYSAWIYLANHVTLYFGFFLPRGIFEANFQIFCL